MTAGSLPLHSYWCWSTVTSFVAVYLFCSRLLPFALLWCFPEQSDVAPYTGVSLLVEVASWLVNTLCLYATCNQSHLYWAQEDTKLPAMSLNEVRPRTAGVLTKLRFTCVQVLFLAIFVLQLLGTFTVTFLLTSIVFGWVAARKSFPMLGVHMFSKPSRWAVLQDLRFTLTGTKARPPSSSAGSC